MTSLLQEQPVSLKESFQPQFQEVSHQKQNDVSKASVDAGKNALNTSVALDKTQSTKDSVMDELTLEIEKLEEQLKAFTRTQQFVEAEELKNRIRELRLELIIKRSREMELRHAEELEQLERSQATEYETFYEHWHTRVAQYREEAQVAEREMLQKHDVDLAALEQDLKAAIPVFARTNPKITNTRKMIDTLAKQKEFVQADKLKHQLTLFEEEEVKKSEEQKGKKITFVLMQLAGKQKNELAALKKRIATGYSELIKARDLESQKLQIKLHNVMKSIETTQQLELSKFEMVYKNYVPGERLRFKARRRGTSITVSSRQPIPGSAGGLNSSFMDSKPAPLPFTEQKKRSHTPMKKGYHVRGYTPTTISNSRGNSLIPINPARFVSNPNERKPVLQGLI